MTTETASTRLAANFGKEYGRNAAEWAIAPDRLSRAQMVSILAGIEQDDARVLGQFNEPNLSGEYRDSPTSASLQLQMNMDDDCPELDDVCEAWEEAARAAFWDRIIEIIKAHTDD